MILLTSRSQLRTFVIVAVVIIGLLLGLSIYRSLTRPTAATTVAESCYEFNSGTGAIEGYNPLTDPGCEVTVLDVPATIGGTPVTTIMYAGLNSQGFEVINLPSSITTIMDGGIGSNPLTSFTINVTGNLVFAGAGIPDIAGPVNITTGGDFMPDNGAFGAVQGPVNISAGGDIVLDGSMYNSSSVGAVSIEADGSVTIGSSTLYNSSGSGITSIDILAGDDVTIENSSFGADYTATSLSIESTNGDIGITGSFSGAGFESANLTANNGSIYTDSSFYESSTTESVTVNAADNFTATNGSFTAMTALTNLDINVSGDVLINSSSFSGNHLASFNLSGVNSATISTTTFGSSYLEELDISATGDVIVDNSSGFWSIPNLESVSLESSTGDVTIGGFSNGAALSSVHLSAGDTLTIQGGSLSHLSILTDITLEADLDLILDSGSVRNNPQLTEITLPASTSLLDFGALSNNNLQAVHLGGTPTINGGAFSDNGIPEGETNLANLSYVPIYTLDPSNPGGYTDTVFTPNGDDPTGGYLINPASYTVTYKNSSDTTLLASESAVGELSPGDFLTDYLVSSNPSEDLSLYYHMGDAYSFTAPAIAPYITPSSQSGLYLAGLNEIAFVYTMAGSGSPDAPNTGLKSISPTWVLAAFAIGGISTIAAVTVYRHKLRQ